MSEKVLIVENLETGHTHTITEEMWAYLSKFPEVYQLQAGKPAQEEPPATKTTRRSTKKSANAAQKGSDSGK